MIYLIYRLFERSSFWWIGWIGSISCSLKWLQSHTWEVHKKWRLQEGMQSWYEHHTFLLNVGNFPWYSDHQCVDIVFHTRLLYVENFLQLLGNIHVISNVWSQRRRLLTRAYFDAVVKESVTLLQIIHFVKINSTPKLSMILLWGSVKSRKLIELYPFGLSERNTTLL